MFQESEKSTSSERLVAGIQKLQIADESYLPSSETASTTSSSGEDAKYQLQKAKLNAFLEECNVEPLVRCWKDWSEANERTQERYVRRSSEIVKSVLSVVYPENCVHLWKEIKVSSAMDKLMVPILCSFLPTAATLKPYLRHIRMQPVGTPAGKSCRS